MLWRIAKDHFRPFRLGEGRRYDRRRVLVLVAVPLFVAALLLWRVGPIAKDSLGNFLTVFSIIAAVLTALLAVVQNGVGGIDVNRKFNFGQKPVHERLVLRVQVLRELFAAISFAVLLLLSAMAPLVLLQVIAPNVWIDGVLSGLVYLSAAAVAVASFHIIFGVYRVLDSQADQVADSLRNSEPQLKLAQSDDDPPLDKSAQG